MAKFPRQLFVCWLLLVGVHLGGYAQNFQRLKLSDPPDTTAQDSIQQIELISAEIVEYDAEFALLNEEAPYRLRGNVEMKHDSVLIYCDSLYQYKAQNRILAFGDVRVIIQDSAELHARKLDYDGNTRILEAFNKVKLFNPRGRLLTPRLTYYRNEEYGQYRKGGTLYNGTDTLTSDVGYYYPNEDMLYFRENVILDNPDYHLETDSLDYDSKNKRAIFVSTTTIINEDGTLLTERGYYDTESKVLSLSDGSSLQNEEYAVKGKSIVFDDENQTGVANGDVEITPSDSSLTIRGQYGEFSQGDSTSFVTDETLAVQYFSEDTLYLTGDTLFSLKDTLGGRVFRVYHNTFFYLHEMQGHADSMVYLYEDSVIYLYGNPVLWSDSTQITADTIIVFLKNEQADSLSLKRNCFVVTQLDSLAFNQLKGSAMQAKFMENQLDWLVVNGNSESIFFAEDEEQEGFMAVYKASSQSTRIDFEDNQVQGVRHSKDVRMTLEPYWEVMFEPNRLVGMPWRISERPSRPESPELFPLIVQSLKPTSPSKPDTEETMELLESEGEEFFEID
jgi:lipopolysaccharide export system protein LptA